MTRFSIERNVLIVSAMPSIIILSSIATAEIKLDYLSQTSKRSKVKLWNFRYVVYQSKVSANLRYRIKKMLISTCTLISYLNYIIESNLANDNILYYYVQLVYCTGITQQFIQSIVQCANKYFYAHLRFKVECPTSISATISGKATTICA